MKYLRSKLIIILITIMTAACLVALSVSISVSIGVLSKHEQSAEYTKDNTLATIQSVYKPVETGKLVDAPLIINGNKNDKAGAYLTSKKEVYIPISKVLKSVGAKSKYFPPDEILEAVINNQKLVIKLGTFYFKLDNNTFNLPYPPVTSQGEILVPIEVLKYIKGFNTLNFSSSDKVFINHYPEYIDIDNSHLKILNLCNGIASINEFTSGKELWNSNSIVTKLEKSNAYAGNPDMLITTIDYPYFLSSKAMLPVKLPKISSLATLSENGKLLYWVDSDKKTSFIYDIKNNKTSELGNYCYRPINEEGNAQLLYGGTTIFDYSSSKNYKRISLTNELFNGVYTFIERNGSTVVSGITNYSPDKKKMLYYKDNKCYYISNDGTVLALLGSAKNNIFRWVNNNKVFAQIDGEYYIITKQGRNKLKTGSEWNMLGVATSGDIFYTDGKTIFCESNGLEQKIYDTPFPCNHVFAASSKGPYVITGKSPDEGIYFLSHNKLTKLGSQGTLLTDILKGEATIDYNGCIRFSPDNKSVVLFQREQGYIKLYVYNAENESHREIVLDSVPSTQKITDKYKLTWISGNRFIVHTPIKGWFIDIKDDVKIHNWTEKNGNTIQEILK